MLLGQVVIASSYLRRGLRMANKMPPCFSVPVKPSHVGLHLFETREMLMEFHSRWVPLENKMCSEVRQSKAIMCCYWKMLAEEGG